MARFPWSALGCQSSLQSASLPREEDESRLLKRGKAASGSLPPAGGGRLGVRSGGLVPMWLELLVGPGGGNADGRRKAREFVGEAVVHVPVVGLIGPDY
jgi:hypothetical protein